MTAEDIVAVVNDLRSGRVRNILPDDDTGVFNWALEQLAHPNHGPVVDASPLFQRYVIDYPKPVNVYDEFTCVAPPWDNALICFRNTFGNIYATQTWSLDARTDPMAHQGSMWQWDTDNEVDWDQVRWTTHCIIWIGGTSRDETGRALPVKTGGPLHMQQIAVYEDGTPANIHWVQLHPKFPSDDLINQLFVTLGALTYLNCRNVELVEPDRPRAERRRLDRLGVRIHTINVFPAGSSTRNRAATNQGVPLGTVRGHMAHYGPEHGKGLLFGKHSGRFWIPMHARGSRDHGETQHDYLLRPDENTG